MQTNLGSDRLTIRDETNHETASWWRSIGISTNDFTVEQEREYETEDGETVTATTETVNPSWRADIRTSQRARSLRGKLGITGREVAQAEQERELREQWAAALNGRQTDADADDSDIRSF